MRSILTLPNLLTFLRLALAPAAVGLLQVGTPGALAWCFVLMLALEASDLADGHLARRTATASDFGKLFDPLADSIYRSLVFLSFLASGWMPLWMVSIIVARDIIVAYLRIFAAQAGIIMGARTSGKVKAIVQGLAQLCVVLAHGLLDASRIDLITYPLLLTATLVTAWSALDYAWGCIQSVRQDRPDGDRLDSRPS